MGEGLGAEELWGCKLGCLGVRSVSFPGSLFRSEAEQDCVQIRKGAKKT